MGGLATGAPQINGWPVENPGRVDACSAAALSGMYSTADTASDAVEIRDIRGGLLRTITRGELSSLANWMSLDAGADGPSALAWTDSGRALFIVVHDDEAGGGGLGSDAIMRYDMTRDLLTLFARSEISDDVSGASHPAAMHFRGKLYVGGDDGLLQIHRALRNDTSSLLPTTVDLGGPVRGLTVDRAFGVLYAATDTELMRSSLALDPPVFTPVGPIDDARSLAHSDHFGGASTTGLYVLDQGGDRVLRVPDVQAIGIQAFNPDVYLTPSGWHDLDATACGRLLAATGPGAAMVSDDTDTRLGFEAWLDDEFGQVVLFCKSLISPNGEPAGWVIDTNVPVGSANNFPASPDGAAWVVMALLMNDHVHGDPNAQPLVRSILTRYAGLAGDGIAPLRSADGIYQHWLNPWTGGVAGGGSGEYATLSTMKIVLAADRARRYYPHDTQIAAAADAIIGGVSNWSSYLSGDSAIYFVGSAAGGPLGGAAGGFHEGIIFVEQAAVYGGATAAFAHWIDRNSWPTATYVNGLPLTSNAPGHFLAGFVSLYSWIVQPDYRDSPAWRSHVANLLASNGGWTDDAGPRSTTVFSAGTTRTDWSSSGYNADSLGDHPGDIATFPSLMAFCAEGSTAPAVGAYEAYRHGARQTFAGGASILYRRSQQILAYTPDSAGLPDVVLGGLGLTELIAPGSLERVLAVGYNETYCPADIAPPAGILDLADINAFVAAFLAGGSAADLAPPLGVLDLADINAFVSSFLAGCP